MMKITDWWNLVKTRKSALSRSKQAMRSNKRFQLLDCNKRDRDTRRLASSTTLLPWRSRKIWTRRPNEAIGWVEGIADSASRWKSGKHFFFACAFARIVKIRSPVRLHSKWKRTLHLRTWTILSTPPWQIPKNFRRRKILTACPIDIKLTTIE